METPVLLLLFNRPDYTKILLDKINDVPFQKIYIAVDGPREGNKDDLINIDAVKSIIANAGLKAESIHKLYQSRNLGCRHGVKAALDWFFKEEEKGIILEDDCIPDLSFFTYCDVLLNKYADDPSVFAISGNSFLMDKIKIRDSYYFTKYFHAWGWATWRRSWEKYDFDMETFPAFAQGNGFDEYPFSAEEGAYWKKFYADVYENLERINSWAYPFCYSVWKNNAVCIEPSKNLVKNIGFGSDATHTKKSPYWYKYVKTSPVTITKHPEKVRINEKADEAMFNFTVKFLYSPPLWDRFKHKIKLLFH